MSITKHMPLKLVALCVALLASVALLAGCESDEVKSAKENLNTEIERVESQMADLQSEIETAEALAQTEDAPLDETVIPSLESAISQAKTIEFTAPDTPSGLDEINAEIDNLKAIDYTADIQTLKDAEQVVNDSIAQMKQVTNPSEAFVIERLQGIEGIGDISAVTEDNDPNGQLGKSGGYTATVYFTSPLVDQSDVIGSTVIEKGTEGGGAIEVYANVDDANKRKDYLSAFDGGILSSGSHEVVGTVLVRTSDKLTASQQKELEAAIIEALTRLS
ncbi:MULTISPECIES: EbhA [Gordonibacter]|uniref:EbhA n=1 Tax=Gordonibacter TaxID=644652 RepID=UPI001950190C|nr:MULTISPECIES: EbhA [Gordonibacter]